MIGGDVSRYQGKRIYIVRHGAFGDVIHCSHLPRLFKKHGASYVKMETNRKGMQVLAHNPYIDELKMLDNADERWATRTYEWLLKHIEAEGEGFDYVFNLDNTLERGYIAMEDMNDYYRDTEYRREKYGKKNYYDIATEICGFEERGVTGDIHFSEDETFHVEKYVKKYEGKTKVMMNLSGSSPQKVFVEWESVCRSILEEYPDSIVWITGDKDCEKAFLESSLKDNPRCRLVAGTWPFRQSLCFTKYINLLVSPESGIAVGSNSFNTPTVQMLTTTSHRNHPCYAKNDFSIQSKAECSPCHKGPYMFLGCHKKNGLPVCTYFSDEDVMTQVRKALLNERVAV